MREKWRRLQEFPDYEVSDRGRVRVAVPAPQIDPQGNPVLAHRLVPIYETPQRRTRVVRVRNWRGRHVHTTTSRLVWQAFRGRLRSDERVELRDPDHPVSPKNLKKIRLRRGAA